MPVLNEAEHIESAVQSALAQDYPRHQVEVIVADGGSADGTRQLISRMASVDDRLRLIDNPGRNQAAGLNRAIAASRGEVIARLDGHAAWPAAHLRRCVELLERTGADNVGGTMAAIGSNTLSRAAARATASPFGVGGARYRYSRQVQETDTVFLGCFRRSALERVGPFDEHLPPHEDYELNYRIRASGGKVVFSPDLPTAYWARTSWRSLGNQFFRYGRGKAIVARREPGVLRPYHLVPPAALVAVPILVSLSSTRIGRRVAVSSAASYVTACIVAAVQASRGADIRVRAQVPFIFPILHIGWGLGFIVGLLHRSRGGSGVSFVHDAIRREAPKNAGS